MIVLFSFFNFFLFTLLVGKIMPVGFWVYFHVIVALFKQNFLDFKSFCHLKGSRVVGW